MRISDWSSDVCSSDLVDRPDGLGFDQQAAIARWHLDAGLKNVGGREALETLPDRHAAAALGDTIFRHGEAAAKRILLKAVNNVRKEQGLPDISNPRSLIGQKLFEAYRDRKSTRLNSSH